MMRNIFLASIVTLSLFITNQSLAGDMWAYDKTISKVQVLATGNFVIRLASSADPVCQGGGKLFHVYENQNTVTSNGIKALLSSAMTALAAGMKVDVRYENANSSCFTRELILVKD